MEQFPEEAIKTNIIGTYNCVVNALKHNVKNFLLISTDKSVNPSSIMGASKNIAEKIVLSANKRNKTKFSVVRFGNVLGSRGSFLPLLKSQIEKDLPITITHPDMRRFFMSISEASKLVIKSLTLDTEGIYVLDMGEQIKIVDLAKKLIELYGKDSNTYPINIIGAFKGEKLDEELTTNPDSLLKTDFERLMKLNDNEHNLESINPDELKRDFVWAISEFEVMKKDNQQILIDVFRKYLPNFRKD